MAVGQIPDSATVTSGCEELQNPVFFHLSDDVWVLLGHILVFVGIGKNVEQAGSIAHCPVVRLPN